MKCQKCESELRKGLSFCPKCGAIIVANSDASIDKAKEYQRKKTPAWLIALAVLFFPISLTYIVVKSKKIKIPLKIILVTILWILVIVIGSPGNKISSDTSNADSPKEKETIEVDNNKEREDVSIEKPNGEIKYHGNEAVNQLLTDYNEIAEVAISPDMVQNGAYNFNANISVDGVWVQIYSGNGLFVDYSDEAESDDHIYPLFRDFTKSLNQSLTDDEINTAWKELQTGKYNNYYTSKYNLGGIQITYKTEKLNNGANRYTIKTELKK